MPILLRFFLFGLCFCCHEGLAQSQLNPEAHTHGMAHMTVLYETGQLLIELEIPVVNMLGFEHSPQDAEQWQQLSLLSENLNAPRKIIDLQPGCKVQSVTVELPFQERAEVKNTSKQPAEHPKQAHDDHMPHEEHENHSDDTHSNYDGEPHETHQDIHLSYAWQCNGRVPPTINLQVFSLYPNFETMQVQWVANGKQGATILNKNYASLEIDQ